MDNFPITGQTFPWKDKTSPDRINKPTISLLSTFQYNKIKELEGFRIKPIYINPELAKCGMALVCKNQLKNYLATIRRNKRDNSNVTKISLNELRDWYLQHNEIPEKEEGFHLKI